jgi:hypothetical protein
MQVTKTLASREPTLGDAADKAPRVERTNHSAPSATARKVFPFPVLASAGQLR